MLSRRLLRTKAIKALYMHLQSHNDNLIASEKSMLLSIDKAYDLYYQMLSLPVEVAHYAEQRQELAKKKQLPTHEDLNPNRKFVDNSVITLLNDSDTLNDYIASRKLGWKKHPELIRAIYNDMLEKDYYKKYMASEERSLREDQQFIEDFYVHQTADCALLDEVIEEMSILWIDDLPAILAMVTRTISNIRQSHTDIKAAPKFKNEDDLRFVKILFQKSLINFSDNVKYIEKFTNNWDMERVVFVDSIIMCAAMTELTTFPDIPIKVTLDEYIDLAKYYSTPGSSLFINGVLDKMVSALNQEEKIKKSGRGLM